MKYYIWKERTRLVKTSVEDSAGLSTRCPLASLIRSLSSVPSDRNITGKKTELLNKIYKNVELHDFKIILLSILQLLHASLPLLPHPDINQVEKYPSMADHLLNIS